METPALDSADRAGGEKTFANVTSARIFFALTALSFLAPLVPEQALRYGGSDTDKAFYFRTLIELTLPFYVYLIAKAPALRPNLRGPLTVAIFGFLLVNIIATVVGVNPALSFWGNLEHMGGVYQLIHLTLLYFYVVLIYRLGTGWRNAFLIFFVSTPLIVALNGLSGKLGGPTLVHDPSLPGRIASTLYNADYLGSYLVIPFFMTVFLGLVMRRRAHKVVCAFLAAFLALVLFLSGTRGALLGVLAGAFGGAFIFLLSTKQYRVKRAGLAAIGAGLVVAVVLFAVAGHLPPGSAFHRLFVWDDVDTKSRLLNWGIALKGYPAHPIFGVGPENYYYISSQYYNPAIHAFDGSYLARPHNYLIELLVTTGPLGVCAYGSMLVVAFWLIRRACQDGRLGLAGFAVLGAALIAYLVQGLTLFDTVSGGMMFFVLLGIAGHMGHESSAVHSADGNHKILRARAKWLVPVAAAVAAIGIFFTNALPFQAAVATARAEASASTDPFQAADFYDQAVNTVNFDQSDVALSLADFAGGLAEGATGDSLRQLAQQELASSVALCTKVSVQDPTNARNWIDLANDYVAQYLAFGGKLDAAQNPLNEAEKLEPQRPEPQLLQADILILQNRLPAAQTLLQQVAETFPDIMRAAQRLSSVLEAEGKTADAVTWFERAVHLGYRPTSYANVSWVGNYYAGRGQYSKEVALYENTLRTSDPNDIDLAVALVNAYVKDGQIRAALALYQSVVSLDPSRAEEMPGVLPGA